MERRAFRTALVATGNTDDALDLVQDAMLDFARRYAVRPEGEWGVLFHRTLHSRITDWYRRSSVRNRFRVWFGGKDGEEDENPLEKLPDEGGADPARALENRQTAAAITAALRKLPMRQRQAFLLRAWEGLDVAQTAFAMGCSEGSVKTHYSRAVHALRTLLEEYRS